MSQYHVRLSAIGAAIEDCAAVVKEEWRHHVASRSLRRMPRVGSAGRLMTGLGVWRSTLGETCGSVRAAVRIVGGRVYSKNGVVGANGVVRLSVSGFGRSASGNNEP